MTIFFFFYSSIFALIKLKKNWNWNWELLMAAATSKLSQDVRHMWKNFILPSNSNMFLINTLNNEHFEQHQNVKNKFLWRTTLLPRSLIFGGLGQWLSITPAKFGIRIFVRGPGCPASYHKSWIFSRQQRDFPQEENLISRRHNFFSLLGFILFILFFLAYSAHVTN